MAYVIVNPKPYDSRPGGQWFVSRSGSEASYTTKLQNARTFNTTAEALREKCDNEYIITVEEAFNR